MWHLTKKSVERKEFRELLKVIYTEEDGCADDEEDIFYNLTLFVDQCAKEEVKGRAMNLTDAEDGKETNMRDIIVALPGLLKFLTGASTITPGVTTIEVCFEGNSGRAKFDTCFAKITFPRWERYTGDNFTPNFLSDILESPGFGRV